MKQPHNLVWLWGSGRSKILSPEIPFHEAEWLSTDPIQESSALYLQCIILEGKTWKGDAQLIISGHGPFNLLYHSCHLWVTLLVNTLSYLLQVCHLYSKQTCATLFAVVRQHHIACGVWYSCRRSGTRVHELLIEWRADFVPLLWFSASCSPNISNSWGSGTWISALLICTLEACWNDASHLLLSSIACTNKVLPSWATGTWQCDNISTCRH